MELSNSFYKNLVSGIKQRSRHLLNRRHHTVHVSWLFQKYLKHLPPNRIHSHELLKHKTFFSSGSEYLHGLHEIFIDQIYNQQLPENAYIIDCGAHIGLSVIYLKSICPSAHIVCFEPDVKSFKLLQKNISSHYLKNINAKNEAVWNINTTLNFIGEGKMDSKIGESSSGNTVSVKATRLNDYITKRVDFLKLDIEGAEYKVLKDIAGSLENVKNMFVEYHGTFQQNNELLEVFEIILNAGFHFYIKEAAPVFEHPFLPKTSPVDYDIQLNIFCIKN